MGVRDVGPVDSGVICSTGEGAPSALGQAQRAILEASWKASWVSWMRWEAACIWGFVGDVRRNLLGVLVAFEGSFGDFMVFLGEQQSCGLGQQSGVPGQQSCGLVLQFCALEQAFCGLDQQLFGPDHHS